MSLLPKTRMPKMEVGLSRLLVEFKLLLGLIYFNKAIIIQKLILGKKLFLRKHFPPSDTPIVPPWNPSITGTETSLNKFIYKRGNQRNRGILDIKVLTPSYIHLKPLKQHIF